jgi:hypothetical protein
MHNNFGDREKWKCWIFVVIGVGLILMGLLGEKYNDHDVFVEETWKV